MILISHRVNKLNQLKKTNTKYGIEVDIRDKNNDLIVTHDPFSNGIKLETYLNSFKHKLIIANIKSERIEDRVIKIFKKKKIKNYFFLDSSIPKIIDMTKRNISNIGLRVSYYENIEIAVKLKGKVKWIWYDTFMGIPKDLKEFRLLKKMNYKICLVSPELHKKKINFNSKKLILLKKKRLIDAICTKEKYFKNWI